MTIVPRPSSSPININFPTKEYETLQQILITHKLGPRTLVNVISFKKIINGRDYEAYRFIIKGCQLIYPVRNLITNTFKLFSLQKVPALVFEWQNSLIKMTLKNRNNSSQQFYIDVQEKISFITYQEEACIKHYFIYPYFPQKVSKKQSLNKVKKLLKTKSIKFTGSIQWIISNEHGIAFLRTINKGNSNPSEKIYWIYPQEENLQQIPCSVASHIGKIYKIWTAKNNFLQINYIFPKSFFINNKNAHILFYKAPELINIS